MILISKYEGQSKKPTLIYNKKQKFYNKWFYWEVLFFDIITKQVSTFFIPLNDFENALFEKPPSSLWTPAARVIFHFFNWTVSLPVLEVFCDNLMSSAKRNGYNVSANSSTVIRRLVEIISFACAILSAVDVDGLPARHSSVTSVRPFLNISFHFSTCLPGNYFFTIHFAHLPVNLYWFTIF